MTWFILGYIFGSASVVLAIWAGNVLAARSGDAVYERLIEGPDTPDTGRDRSQGAPDREVPVSGLLWSARN